MLVVLSCVEIESESKEIPQICGVCWLISQKWRRRNHVSMLTKLGSQGFQDPTPSLSLHIVLMPTGGMFYLYARQALKAIVGVTITTTKVDYYIETPYYTEQNFRTRSI